MRDFGLKHTARTLAQENGVPLLPGSGLLDDLQHARREAIRLAIRSCSKVLLAVAVSVCSCAGAEQELTDAFHSVERLARTNFSQGGIFLEKYVETCASYRGADIW